VILLFLDKEKFYMDSESKQNYGGTHKLRMGKFFALLFLFIVISSFLAPQRAKIIVVDMSPNAGGGIISEAESIYLHPFYGTDYSLPIKDTFITWRSQRMLFNSFAKRIIIKGKTPNVPAGREYIIGAVAIDKNKTIFAWDLWLAFYVLPSFLLALVFSRSKIDSINK
jgi:hypothetical protein